MLTMVAGLLMIRKGASLLGLMKVGLCKRGLKECKWTAYDVVIKIHHTGLALVLRPRCK